MKEITFYFSNNWRTKLVLRCYPNIFMHSIQEHINKLKQQASIEPVANKKQIQFLPQLNAKELVSLLNNTIRPLEKYLQQMVAVLEESNPIFLADTQQSLLQEAKHNLKVVIGFKSKTHEALLTRCEQCTLDDDTRIQIYDILINANFDEQAVYSTVMLPVRKKVIKPFTTKQKVNKKLKKTAQFIDSILTEIAAENAYQKLFSYRIIAPDFGFLGDASPSLVKAFFILYRFRYLFLVAASYIAYGILMQFITPILLVSVGSSILNAVNSFLFYSLGLAPLWYWGINHANSIIKSIGAFVLINEHQRIITALITLEQTGFFIANRLSQAIVDVAHFDFEQLYKEAKAHEMALNTISSNLRQTAGWKRWLMTVQYGAQVTQVLKKLEQQHLALKKQLAMLAKHLADEIGEELTLLSDSPDNTQLTAHLAKNQLTHCTDFVQAYGDPQTKQKYAHNANIIELWVNKIEVSNLAHERASQTKQKVPWGGYDIRVDALKGWAILLDAFIVDENQKGACLYINEALKGKKTLSLEELKDKLKAIHPQYASVLLHKIQWFIFNTLTQRNKEHAALLSLAQKDLIIKWFDKNKKEIASARKIILSIFSQNAMNKEVSQFDKIPDDTLAYYYELLDTADLYYHASSQTHLIQETVNAARKFFEAYQGDDAQTYRFLKFVPKREKTSLLCQIATKRLNWLISHLALVPKQKWFSPIDSELFHNFRLLSIESTFDFDEIIMASSQYNQPYNAHMERFLLECQGHGFGGDPLLQNYLARHKQAKAMLFAHKTPKKVEKLIKSCEKTSLKRIAAK